MATSEESSQEAHALLLDNSHADADNHDVPRAVIGERDKRIALIGCFLVVFTNALLATLMATPVLRLFEASACRDYYLAHDATKIDTGGYVPEELCKLAPIQEEIVFLNTSIATLTSIISLIVTIPFGIIADKYGRKLVLGLNALAELLFYCCIGIIGYYYKVFPSRTYIATGLCQVMGGGGRVVSAMILSIISDVSTPDSRTQYFYYMEAADYTTQLIAPGIASLLMMFSLWVPFTLGLLTAVFALLAVLILPETAPIRLNPSLARNGTLLTNATQEVGTTSEGESLLPESERMVCNKYRKLLELLPKELPKLPAQGIVRSLLAFLLAAMARSSLPLLQQFASNELQWTIAQAASIISFRAGVSWILFAVALPILRSYLIQNRTGNAADLDLNLARLSLILLLGGSCVIGLNIGPVVFFLGVLILSLGDGFNMTMQACVTASADASDIAQICSWMAMLGTVGSISGRPLMMVAYHYSWNLGDRMHGLPFELAALLYTGAIGLCY